MERQPCIVHMQRTVARRCRGMDPETSTHQDRAVLPILVDLWEATMAGRVRLASPVQKLL